jgi:hypothetical protein
MGLVNEGSGNLVPIGRPRSEGEKISGEEALEYLGHQLAISKGSACTRHPAYEIQSISRFLTFH